MKCPTYELGCKLKAMPHNMMTKITGSIGEVEHFEGLFCSFGKSKCITDLKDCICESCEVYKDNSLSCYGYCTVEGGMTSHMG